jgi:hypothetical protein
VRCLQNFESFSIDCCRCEVLSTPYLFLYHFENVELICVHPVEDAQFFAVWNDKNADMGKTQIMQQWSRSRVFDFTLTSERNSFRFDRWVQLKFSFSLLLQKMFLDYFICF